MAEWRRLAADLPELRATWNGGLCWDLPAAKLESYAREHGGWGYGIGLVDRQEAQRLEPNLTDPPETAVHVAEEGSVEPKAAALTLLAAAERLGARLIVGQAVRALTMRGESVIGVRTDAAEIRADETVLAAGAASPALAASTSASSTISAASW